MNGPPLVIQISAPPLIVLLFLLLLLDPPSSDQGRSPAGYHSPRAVTWEQPFPHHNASFPAGGIPGILIGTGFIIIVRERASRLLEADRNRGPSR